MNCRIRAARDGDLEHLYKLAKLTGGGLTNLPPDKKTLRAKLDRSHAAFERAEDSHIEELFVLMLENVVTGDVLGTCQLMTSVGQRLPFYSYRRSTETRRNELLDKTIHVDLLSLCNDLIGCSEVGGLFIHPDERASGLGMLLARSRYLFVASHRARFGEKIVAELRGVIDEGGRSPFWDGLAGRFYGMSFQEADESNAIYGYQFIADLMPTHPIYPALLPEAARAVMGVPHSSSRAAMRMLENEGFAGGVYFDIFDGGPTMTAGTDDIRTIREARTALVTAIEPGGDQGLVAHGRLADFRCAQGGVKEHEGGVALDPDCARLLEIGIGDEVIHVAR
jgi:arginine N-succinyltransferase